MVISGSSRQTRSRYWYAKRRLCSFSRVTGPNRSMIEGSELDYVYAAPGGDVMMTGPIGLVGIAKRILPLARALQLMCTKEYGKELKEYRRFFSTPMFS